MKATRAHTQVITRKPNDITMVSKGGDKGKSGDESIYELFLYNRTHLYLLTYMHIVYRDEPYRDLGSK